MTKNQILEMFPIGPVDGPQDSRRYDPISAAVIGVGGSLIGGAMGSGAAKRASEAQVKAATEAKDLIGTSVGDANHGISDATRAGQEVVTAGGQRVIDTAGAAATGATNAANSANSLLDPYAKAGSTASGVLNSGIAAGGDFNKTPTLADLQIDPGYAFRAQQGELALSRSAAAHGGALGGGAAKDLANYSQGLASQEYQNAFNRFQTSTQNRFNNVMGVSNAGQNAAGQQGLNSMNAAQYGGNITTNAANTALGANEFVSDSGLRGAGMLSDNTMNAARSQADLITQKGNAQAGGIVNSANAWTNALSGSANAVSNASFQNLLQNPATSGYYSSSRGYVKT